MQTFLDALYSLNTLEVIAVGLGLAYLIFILRQSSWAWYCAFIGTGLSIKLFWDSSLPMEAALHIYYLIMAVYGWWCWRSGMQAKPLAISVLSWRMHGLIWLLLGILMLVNGHYLAQYTKAALPYLDSFTTWGAVITTVLVARKKLDNWAYWIIIDTAAAYMYWQRELYLYTGLMLVYLVLVAFGWWKWQQEYKAAQAQNYAAAN